MAAYICLFLLFVTVAKADTSPEASTDGISISGTSNVVFGGSRYLFGYNGFLPAPPGKRPPCAGPSSTYCEKIDHYPSDLIDFLLRRYGYDFNTLILDETADTVQLGQSLATPYSVGPIFIPGQSSNFSATVPLHSISDDTLRYDTPYSVPYVGPYIYTNPADPWWYRYITPLIKPKQHTISTSYRVLRQTETTSSNGEQLCPTISQFIVPKAALNTKGNWMFVVNQESNSQVTQLVRAERCATTQCSGLCQLPSGFTSSCQQQFVQKRLVALSANGQNLYTDTFWFPHCCICQISSSSSSNNNNNNSSNNSSG